MVEEIDQHFAPALSPTIIETLGARVRQQLFLAVTSDPASRGRGAKVASPVPQPGRM